MTPNPATPATGPSDGALFRNRIVGHGDEDPRALIPNPANFKQHPKEQRAVIRGSLAELGWVRTVLKNRLSGRLIDGHARVEEAIERGEATVPVTYVELSDEEERMALALLDPLVGLATQDDAKLEALVSSINAEDASLRHLIASMRAEEEKSAVKVARDEEEPADEPTAPREQITQPGDMWLLGRNRLLCGDATKPEDVARLMNGEKAAAVVTDPPYAIYGSSTGIAADITDDKMIRPFFRAIVNACVAVLDPFGHVYIACDWRSWASWWEVAKGTGIVPKNMIVWNKGGGLGSSYANAHELFFFGSLIPLRDGMTQKITGVRPVLDVNVWDINRLQNRAGQRREHNAQKPVELMERAIRNSTDPGALVVDFFSGSGTTLLAAIESGRRAYLMDIDPKWCDLTIRRWEKLTGLTAQRQTP